MWVIALAVGLWSTMLVYWVLLHRDRTLGWNRRVDRAVGAPAEKEPPRPLFERLGRKVGATVRAMVPGEWTSTLHDRLYSAGMRTRVEVFLGWWVLVIATWYGLVAALAVGASVPTWLLLAAVGLAPMLPIWQISREEAERIQRIRRTFPFLIDFVTMTVEAGMTLESGLLRAAEKVRGPLGEEAILYVRNTNLGMPRKEALMAFAKGLGIPEAREFAQVLIHGGTLGLPMAGVLRSQAQEFRENRRLMAEEAAQKIPVKLLFPLVVFIFPTMFLFILGPAVIWFLQNGPK